MSKKPTVGSSPKPVKQKYVECNILPHHLNYLKVTKDNGANNITNSLWLTAFAIYNLTAELKLSPEYHGAYHVVYNYIDSKLK